MCVFGAADVAPLLQASAATAAAAASDRPHELSVLVQVGLSVLVSLLPYTYTRD